MTYCMITAKIVNRFSAEGSATIADLGYKQAEVPNDEFLIVYGPDDEAGGFDTADLEDLRIMLPVLDKLSDMDIRQLIQ